MAPQQHIIQVSAYYPPHLGGQEIIVQQLASRLTMKGEKVEVVTSALGAQVGVTVENGLSVVRLRSAEFGHTAIIWGLFWWLLRNAKRQTIIHLHAGQAFTPEVVWLTSKFRRFSYILHLHTDPMPSGVLGKWLLPAYKKISLRTVIRSAKTVVVLNDHHARSIRENNAKTKVIVMSNGVEEEFFTLTRRPATSQAINFLYVGRLSPQKNLAALLVAMSKSGHDLSLDIVGEGECRDELNEIIRERGLINVRLHGQLDRSRVKDFYATHTALIFPSLCEAQPVVLLEAMASRIPVIASRILGVESLLSDGRGILVDPDWEGLVEGIRTFAEMPAAAREAMIYAAFTRALEFSWDRLLESYVSLYR